MKRKARTLAEIERMQAKAVQFLREVVGDDDKADDFDEMTAEEYAVHKGITIRENPVVSQRSMSLMAATAGPTKDELSQALDDIEDILQDALDPELTREDVVAKVKEAYDIACGEEEDDEDANTEDDDPE